MPPAPDADPSIDLGSLSITNLRDLGGTPAREGARIAHGRLLRSASLSSAGLDEVRALRRAGVADVIDLRADWEVDTAGAVPSLFTTHRLVLVPDDARDATHEVLRTGGLAGYYVWILDHARPQLVELVEIVAQAEGGVLVQCGAGKDRTGIAIAVLLDLLGVDDDRIGVDYARTTDALAAIRTALQRTPGYERAISELPREVLHAPARAIIDALHELRVRSGSLTSHLVAGGLDRTAPDRLRARLLT